MYQGKENTEHTKLNFDKTIGTIRQHPEMRDELFQYEKNYGKVKGPFKGQYWFQQWGSKIYTDVKFFTPVVNIGSEEKTLLLISFILNPLTTLAINLNQCNSKFHIVIKDDAAETTYCLEDIPASQLTTVLTRNIYEIIRFCNVYHAEKPEMKNRFEESLCEKIEDWNTHPEIIRQKYYRLSRNKTLPDMAAIGELSEKSIISALDDYQTQRKQRILNNFSLLHDYMASLPTENPYYNGRIYEIIKKIMNGLESCVENREAFLRQLIYKIKGIDKECVLNSN